VSDWVGLLGFDLLGLLGCGIDIREGSGKTLEEVFFLFEDEASRAAFVDEDDVPNPQS